MATLGWANYARWMSPPPAEAKIRTNRLLLRPLVSADAPDVAKLAGRREIADTTLSIPHPYSEAQAQEWIRMITGQGTDRERVFAILMNENGRLIGTVGLREIDKEHALAEMGFWIGVDLWNQGFASEAGRALVDFGFAELDLNRIYAHHMTRNPASGRVLEKIGMKPEGLLRQRVRKWGVFEDVVVLAILRADWEKEPGRRALVSVEFTAAAQTAPG